METHWPEPVKQLLTCGDARKMRKWPNYLEYGLTREHIPELIAMLTDEELLWANSESLEVWAPLHAWRALGQLHAVEAIPVLVEQLYRIDEYDDDWILDDFPVVFEMLGVSAIPPLRDYLVTPRHALFARVCAANSLAKIGAAYPDARAQCVEALTHQLAGYRHNDPTLNGFLVSYLADLKAVEALEPIRQAYRHDCVDLSILGDIEDAEIDLGVRDQRTTPPPRLEWIFDEPPPAPNTPPAQQPVRKGKKIGRNDPCPCGSGKKYKKCCLEEAAIKYR